MKKLVSVLSVVAVMGAMASAPASAWFGGPGGFGQGGGPWQTMTDAFGGGDINFNAKSYGSGRGSGYAAPYYGYGYGGYPGYGGYGGYPGYGGYGGGYPGYGAPVAPPVPVAPK